MVHDVSIVVVINAIAIMIFWIMARPLFMLALPLFLSHICTAAARLASREKQKYYVCESLTREMYTKTESEIGE